MSHSVEPSERRVVWEMTFAPSVELVSVVRRFVAQFYDNVLDDKDAISRVAMATHELVENAAKYSSDGETAVHIEVVDHDPGSRIRIRIGNRADAAHLETVRAAFAAMQACPDADAYYQLAMRQSAKRKDGSGLGLARVRAEGEMAMSFEVTPDHRVWIVAETAVSAKIAA